MRLEIAIYNMASINFPVDTTTQPIEFEWAEYIQLFDQDIVHYCIFKNV